MTKPKVKILLAVPDEKSFGPCTMVLDTIRVGYPTAFVDVWLNPGATARQTADIAIRAERQGCQFSLLNREFHHAEWITDRIDEHAADLGDQCPLIFIDGDVRLHKSCEDWQFDTHLAGYGVPSHWSDAAGCRAFARLHTSHLWLTNVRSMMQKIRDRFPHSFEPLGRYCPIDIVSPAIKVVDGEPFFWDTTCVAYQLLGGYHFSGSELRCFNHLGSATAIGAMRDELKAKGENLWLHERGYQDMDWIKQNLWRIQGDYYAAKADQFKP